MQQWQTDMVNELNKAKHGERDGILEKYARLTGLSKATLIRRAAKKGVQKQSRKKRVDAGQSSLTDDQIRFVAGLLETSKREIKGVIMPVETALQIAEDNGVIEPRTISVSRMQQILKERKMNKKQLDAEKPHIHMKSLHPNHVHVFDMSVCIQYYLRDGEGFRIEDERKFYKNKPENFQKKTNKLIRYVLVDHYSGTIFFKYYYATGETQENLFDFLVSAWAMKEQRDKFPFFGVPKMVLMDAGAANTSKAMLEWMGKLEIDLPKALPHNPRRQGSAEKAQQLIESQFESRLRVMPAKSTEQLNKWAYDFASYFNGTKVHSRHGLTRTECWMRITPDQLRILPPLDVLKDLFANPTVERVVNNSYAISYKGKEYNLKHIEGIMPKDRVQVVLRPFDLPSIGVVYDDAEYLCEPIQTDEAGFREDAAIIGQEFKAAKETPLQKTQKQITQDAYGTAEPAKNQNPYEGIKTMGGLADKVKTTYIPKKGESILIQDAAEKRISLLELKKRIVAELGRITPELNKQLKAMYPSGVGVLEAEEIIKQIKTTGGMGEQREESDMAQTGSA